MNIDCPECGSYDVYVDPEIEYESRHQDTGITYYECNSCGCCWDSTQTEDATQIDETAEDSM
jgi:hypothetical protein